MYTLSPPIWREPKQARSEQRFEAILTAAKEIIVEKGLEGLQMRELSKQANVPIGTLYHFFDNRDAILAYLASRYLTWQDHEISKRFNKIDSVDGWLNAVKGAGFIFYERNLQDPAIAEIWRAASPSNAVRQIDNASTQRHTKLLFDMLRPFLPTHVTDEDLTILCQMVCELTATAIRMALQLPKEKGVLYINQFEEMVRARLAELMKENKSS